VLSTWESLCVLVSSHNGRFEKKEKAKTYVYSKIPHILRIGHKECSGIHRSLGTHISKVRSFNLDTTSYTRDLFDYIRAVGNEVSNSIWEARLLTEPPSPSEDSDAFYFQKPVTNDSREHKVAFIRKKYVERAFIAGYEGSETSQSRTVAATSALFQAVEDNNISAAIKALAAGADLNAAQRANKHADSGPFFEEQTDPTVIDAPPPFPARQQEDTFGLGSIPNIAESPIMTEGVWQTNGVDDTNVSDAGSSRFSRSTIESISDLKAERLSEPRSRDQPPSQGGTWELLSRPPVGRPISSVMVMQTSPLLMALRQGVPFSQDSAFEVYPMAEFLIQNGAASNMSVQVKVLGGGGPLEAGRTMASPLPTRPLLRRKGDLDAASQGIIEQDVLLQASTSIVSRLSENSAQTTSMASSSRTLSTAPSFDTTDGDDDATENSGINRRSVGQVVELRGESGASAVEYLRGKRVARGEAGSVPQPSPSPAPMVPNERPGSRSSTDFLSPGGPAPADAGVSSSSSSYTSSISTTWTNLLTLSPRLRPERASVLPPSSAPTSLDPSLTPPGSGSGANMSSSQTLFSGPRQPTQTQQPDISTLFQKRRESDGGLGSVLFSARRGGEKDKEKIAAKAKARMSGDFSFFQPTSIFPSFTSSSSQEQQQQREPDQEQQAQSISRTTSPPLSLSLSQSSSLYGGATSNLDLSSYAGSQGGMAGNLSAAAATSMTPSRAQKVTNALMATSGASSSTTLPAKHYGGVSSSSQQDFGPPIEFEGEEPTMEELLRQQDQQLYHQQVEAQSRSRLPGPRGDGDIFAPARTSMSSLSLSFSAPSLTAVALDDKHNIAQ